MDIEEEVYEQPELFGDYPHVPQWQACVDELITDTTETESVHVPIESGFYHDLFEGDI